MGQQGAQVQLTAGATDRAASGSVRGNQPVLKLRLCKDTLLQYIHGQLTAMCTQTRQLPLLLQWQTVPA